MSIIYFLIILSVLVIVHELGHFLTAKAVDIRVDEFGLGYPPRAAKLFRSNGTDFTLNWLPFGGFVKIFVENPDSENALDPKSFASKKRDLQALVLVAGVSANILFAWALLSFCFMIGLPASSDSDLPVTNARTVITQVVPDSPAFKAGIRSGDVLVALARGSNISVLTPDGASDFITSSDKPLSITILRGGEETTKTVTPVSGIVEGKPAAGVMIDSIGEVKLSFGRAVIEGARTTWRFVIQPAVGLVVFLKNILIGQADFSEVAGPVGLVGLVKSAHDLGLAYLLSFTALISINLAVINLLPIPALDGGRLLFVGIEAIRRKNISPKVFNLANTIGFSLLILLMVVVTFRDVMHLL